MNELRALAELLAGVIDGIPGEGDLLVEDVTCVTEEPAGTMQFYAMLDTGHNYSVTVRRES